MLEEEKVVAETNEAPVEAPVEAAPTSEAKEAAAPRDSRRPRGDRRNSGDRKGGRKFDRRDQPKEFESRVVYINRVCKTVKGGRRMKFSALVVVGNGKGKYGFASAKAAEVPDAIKKAEEQAKKNLHEIKLVKGNTISHEIVGKFGAVKVYLKPAPEGTGIVAGGPVRAVLELAGVKNICSKVYGSREAINIVRATSQGLDNLKSYKETRALRGLE